MNSVSPSSARLLMGLPAGVELRMKVVLKRASSTSPPRQSSGTNEGKTGSLDEEQDETSAPAAHSAQRRLERGAHRFPNFVQRHGEVTGEDDSAGRGKRSSCSKLSWAAARRRLDLEAGGGALRGTHARTRRRVSVLPQLA